MNLNHQPSTLITCSPGPSYFGASNLAEHNITQISDPGLAAKQHISLVKTIEKAGARVIELKEMQGHPNSVFTKDTAVCTPKGYIRVRMGLPSREGEEKWMAESLDKIGVSCFGAIEAPGKVEGGDVILTDDIAFIGHSSRTNPAGIEQLINFLKKAGYETRTAKVPAPFLHLGGAITLVSPDTILCVNGLFPKIFFTGFHRIEVRNTGFISGNVIPLSNRQIIADQSNTASIEALRHKGFTVYPLSLSEFVKGTGGPSCLIMQVSQQLIVDRLQ